MRRPRILFIDAYDSFSNNIVSLLTTALDAEVDVLTIDEPHLHPKDPEYHNLLHNELRQYDAVVCGPGPGAPDIEKDVGIMKDIFRLEGENLLPVLGICLGFQCLIHSYGGVVKRLRTGLHGMIREIDHSKAEKEGNIFKGVPDFKVTLYHSLHADIGQECLPAAEWEGLKWASPTHLSDLVALAWTYEDRGDETERILMGVKHKNKPFWGLQYHPESICTEITAHQVIKNWFLEATNWNRTVGRIPVPKIVRNNEVSVALYSQLEESHPWGEQGSKVATSGVGAKHHSRLLEDIPLHIEVPDVVEILQEVQCEFIVLDSASAKTRRTGSDVRGRYSIIALDVDEALKLEYRTGSGHVMVRDADFTERVELGSTQTIWQFLSQFWAERQLIDEETPGPFIGGFMGYTTYELGLEGIHVDLYEERRHERPDLCFAWVTKSIVIDHLEGTLRIQTLSTSSDTSAVWLELIASKLISSPIWSNALPANFGKTQRQPNSQLTPPHTPVSGNVKTKICTPDAREYDSKVSLCQEFIAAGDSYELCLTGQTIITKPRSHLEGRIQGPPQAQCAISSPPSSWQLYRDLRTRQPAPFGSYIRLGPATLVSSSPERFVTFDTAGLCSMRPMKGTVRKSPTVSTLEAAEKILHVPKEEAENLMIVDLVRHDLHGVCGAGNVQVPHLLKVEEYASVFQMISVVEGRLPQPQQGERRLTGLDVLSASLPPGSMTGAPKKRSCEILQGLEGPRGRNRSLYSGVIGYMDAAGRGDWSVTIRSLFRWDDESTSTPYSASAGPRDTEIWHIGAGGAVTALSTPEGETDEMFTKLKGPLGIFEEA
ncbi:aminodeoxychorismate synthase [Xylariaceae sp. FL0255]|nr:aminodeoxychorismate synthase [Xylariaceae sp. FL0255]